MLVTEALGIATALAGVVAVWLMVWLVDVIANRRRAKMEPKQAAAQQQAEAKQEKPAPESEPKPATDLGDLMIELAKWQGRKAGHAIRPDVGFDVVGGQVIDGKLWLRLEAREMPGLMLPADGVREWKNQGEARTFVPLNLDAKPLTMTGKDVAIKAGPVPLPEAHPDPLAVIESWRGKLVRFADRKETCRVVGGDVAGGKAWLHVAMAGVGTPVFTADPSECVEVAEGGSAFARMAREAGEVIKANEAAKARASETKPLAPGDVVRLKSGGDPMTVQERTHRDGREVVKCCWYKFDAGAIHTWDFTEAMLKRVEPVKKE